jgi:hypothetical protein
MRFLAHFQSFSMPTMRLWFTFCCAHDGANGRGMSVLLQFVNQHSAGGSPVHTMNFSGKKNSFGPQLADFSFLDWTRVVTIWSPSERPHYPLITQAFKKYCHQRG